jgi:hypothetical protein
MVEEVEVGDPQERARYTHTRGLRELDYKEKCRQDKSKDNFRGRKRTDHT